MPTLQRAALHVAALLAVGGGLTRRLRTRRLQRQDFRLFILEYHDVSPNGSEFEGTISQSRFCRHLKWLKQRFEITSLQAASDRLGSGAALRNDLVVLTFDDGYEGNFTGAWPALRAEAVPATIFLTTGFLDGQELWFDLARRYLAAARASPSSLSDSSLRALVTLCGRWPTNRSSDAIVQHLKKLDPADRAEILETFEASSFSLAPRATPLSWEQVRTMQRSGIEFGAHTVTHPMLSRLSREEQESEILLSRNRIEQETQCIPLAFAYPNGSAADYTEDTIDIVRGAGFQAACTTRKGSNRPGCAPFELRRIGIGPDPTWVVDARLSGLFDDQVRRLLTRPRL